MNFIIFNAILLFAGFLAVLIFSVGLMAVLAPMALFKKSGNPPKIITIPLLGIIGIYQIYFWGFWSAFCVVMTFKFAQRQEVTLPWLYWIAGFMWCISLIGWLAHKEQQSSQSLEEAQGIQKGTTFYSLIAIAAFLVFAFIPSLMQQPYGWALKLLNEKPKTSNVGKINGQTQRSIEGFFNGYEHVARVSNLSRSMLNSNDIIGDFEKAKTLLVKAKKELSKCDNTTLNEIYNGWGDVVTETLIPSIDFYLEGSQPNSDRNSIAKGDSLLIEFDNWLQENWNGILLRLSEHGYEIKK